MKKLLIILVLLYSNTSKSQTDSVLTINNNILGFSLNYPSSWVLNTAKDYFDQIDRAKGLLDSELEELIMKNINVPFIHLSKFKEPYKDINPTIKIKAMPYRNPKIKDSKIILNAHLEQMSSILEDFEYIEEPIETTIENHKTTYTKFKFTINTQSGNKYYNCTEMYFIELEKHYFSVIISSKQDESNCKREELKEIIKTIKIN